MLGAAPPHLSSSPPTWTQASPARTVTLFTCHPLHLHPSGCCQFDQVEHLSVCGWKSVKPRLKSVAIPLPVNDACLLVRKVTNLPGDENSINGEKAEVSSIAYKLSEIGVREN